MFWSSLQLGNVLPLQQHGLGWGAPRHQPAASADNAYYYYLLFSWCYETAPFNSRSIYGTCSQTSSPVAQPHKPTQSVTHRHSVPPTLLQSLYASRPDVGRAHTNRNPRPPPVAHADVAKTGSFGLTCSPPATTICEHPGIKGEKSTTCAAQGFAGLVSSRSCWQGQPLYLCPGIGCFYFTKTQHNAE